MTSYPARRKIRSFLLEHKFETRDGCINRCHFNNVLNHNWYYVNFKSN